MGGQDGTHHEKTAGVCAFHFRERDVGTGGGGVYAENEGRFGIISDGSREKATVFRNNYGK